MSVLQEKVALVTGSSRGIGAAIARVFAQAGATLAVHGRDLAALSAVRADIERAGGQVVQVAADVTKFAEIEAMRREIEGELCRVDYRDRPGCGGRGGHGMIRLFKMVEAASWSFLSWD